MTPHEFGSNTDRYLPGPEIALTPAPREQKTTKRWTTASSLDRVVKLGPDGWEVLCPASTVLPQVEDEVTDSQRRSRAYGKGIHHWIETGELLEEVDGVKEKWLKPALEKKIALSGVQRDDWYSGGQHEAKLLVTGPDLTECSLLVGTDHTIWPTDPESIRVQCDFTGTHKGEPHADDLKTGRFAPLPSSAQVAVAALAVSDLNGGVGVWGSITHWPRYPLEDAPNREWHWYDRGTLDNLRLVLRMVRSDALSGDPTVRPGPHCEYCRCKPSCPAHNF